MFILKKNIYIPKLSLLTEQSYTKFLNKICISNHYFFTHNNSSMHVEANKNYLFFFFCNKKINLKLVFIYFKVNFLLKKKRNQKILNSNSNFKNVFIFKKLIRLFSQIFWFNLHCVLIKNLILFELKEIFFTAVYRDNFLRHKIKIFFFETKKIEFLTAALISNYIIRNLKVGNTLGRVIYPLMRNLQKSRLYCGWKIGCSGRFKRRGRAQRTWYGRQGVALNTISAQIDFTQQIVRLRNGICCIKVFLSRKPQYIYHI